MARSLQTESLLVTHHGGAVHDHGRFVAIEEFINGVTVKVVMSMARTEDEGGVVKGLPR
jgi:hypothetical protein